MEVFDFFEHLFCLSAEIGYFGICLDVKILTYAEYAAVFPSASSFKIAQSLQIKYLRARLACEESGAGSFGICLVAEILTYAEYAAVSSPASSFKIVLALQIRRTRSEWKEVSRSCVRSFSSGRCRAAYLARWLSANLVVDEPVG